MLHRRDAMLSLGRFGLGALTLPAVLQAEEARGALPRHAPSAPPATARSCILVFLWGGPPQQDTFDLKPDAPDGIRSPFQPIPTSASGIEIADQLPLTARVMDRVTLVRSVTHGSDIHEVGCYHMLTGQEDTTLVVPRNNRRRTHWPGPGGVLSCLRPSERVPSSVTLPRPIMHDGVKYAGTHAGWLGARYDPVELPDAAFAGGRPRWDFGLAPGLSDSRLVKRRGLLHAIEATQRYLDTTPVGLGMHAYRERAFDLLVSPEAKRAFNLELEPPSTRDAYGRNHYGEAFLLARRLIEAGVRIVTINWMFFRPDGNPLNPWDNHGGTPALGGVTGYEMLKAEYCLPSLDRAYSSLIRELDERGLLDETLVVAMGEFGRTPKINATQGRDHWGACQTVALAGAGIRRGFVYGASDDHAAYPTEDPVRPADLLATLYHAFGIAPTTELRDQENRPHPVSYGVPVTALFG